MSKKADGMWTVFDTNATQPDGKGGYLGRKHEVRLGKMYELFADKGVKMPPEDARVFLCDVAFRVLDHNGDYVVPLSEQQKTRILPETLPPHMVLANLDELTSTALLTRASQFNGGHRFKEDTRREIMISFLTDANRAAAGLPPGAPSPASVQSVAVPEAGGGFEDVEDDETGDLAARVLEGA